MSDLKTKKNSADVSAFLNKIGDEEKRLDCFQLLGMFSFITGKKPMMWGTSMVGFGEYHYKYASGRTGDWLMTGYSPRAANITIYIMLGFDNYKTLMENLGKYKISKSCLYIKKLDDIHLPTLRDIIRKSVSDMRKKYPCK